MANYLLILDYTETIVMKSTLNHILFVFLILGTLSACKSTEEVAISDEEIVLNETETPANIEPPEEQSAPETPPSTEPSFFASIYRSPCFGACPTYRINIMSNGLVELEGIRAIELIGNYTTTISDEQLEQFSKTATEIGFMDMDAKYDGMITDLPSTTTTIVLDGKKKEVYRRYNYPRSILQLETLFDDLLQTQEWVKVEEVKD